MSDESGSIPATDISERWGVYYMSADPKFEDVGYWFHHEADDVIMDICKRYEQGKLTVDQTRQALQPYLDFIYLDDYEDEGKFSFPFVDGDSVFLPATRHFEFEAASLGIPGVAWSEASFDLDGEPELRVADEAALEALRDRLKDRYVTSPGIW